MDQQPAPPARKPIPKALRVLLIVVGVIVGVPCLSMVSCIACHKIGPLFDGGVGETKANEVFGPALETMAPEPKAKPEPYDIDQTIRVMHAIDQALQDRDGLEQHLQTLAMQDYRGVAPEVLESRTEMLERLKELYALYGDEEDHEVLFADYRKLFLSVASNLEGSFGVGLAVNFDPESLRRQLDELELEQEEQRRIRKQVRESEQRLIDSLVNYGEVYYKYLDEWDRLCLARDRAYLAAWDKQWDKVLEASEVAMELAPHEREAVLLRAMALLESNPPIEATETGQAREARELLAEYIDENPDRTAPALLLMGVAERQAGNLDEARLLFDQAAAYFPKQADYLTDNLDAYRQRAFLRKSREGRRVVELYKDTMLGAGYFSPDMQMAKYHRDQGDTQAMRDKVLDHFSRRRAQRQLDYIISDLEFCYDFLGIDFFEIFPEEFYLDLEYNPTLMGLGDSINLDVTNRSSTTLHNATLVLCIHFTEMVRGDYETFMAPKVAPAIVAGKSTDFGNLEIKYDLFGRRKGVRDIVECRAVLITNEAVVWVDTDAYKLARVSQLAQEHPPLSQKSDGLAGLISEQSLEKLLNTAIAVTDNRFSDSTNVEMRLPKELALLKPIFRLATDLRDGTIPPAENLIQDGEIRLKFDGVPGQATKGPEGLDLLVDTAYGSFLFDVTRDENGKLKLSVKPQEAAPESPAPSPGS